MPNMNQPTCFIAGRNPYAKNNRPPFAHPEQTEAVLWLKDGEKDPSCSDAASAAYGLTNAGNVLNFHLESDKPCLNGIVVEGGTSVIMDPDISLSGCGCSDFTCKGTAIMAESGAKVDIRGAKVVTNGATRAATIATTGSVLKVYDSVLESHGGPLPEDYVPVIGPGMMEPPAPLGLAGNCRTHLSMDNSESYFYNCRVYGEAWAALSTDASGGHVYLEANDSEVEMKGNGYCVYADNGCHVVLNRCSISSGNVFGIQDGNSSMHFRDVDGTCKGYGFLVHGGMHDLEDIGTIRVQNSRLHSVGPMFRCKSTNVDIYVKDSVITAENGLLVETMITDDTFYYRTRAHAENEYGEQFTFEGCELKGDMRFADAERVNRLSLCASRLTGRISGFPVLNLAEGAVYHATADSQITFSGNADGIDALEGVVITCRGYDGPAVTLPSGGTLLAE